MSQQTLNLLESIGLSIEIIRTDRKRSVSMQLEGEKLRIRVPKTLEDKVIQDLIIKKSTWIKKKLAQNKNKPLIVPPKYADGEYFKYLGEDYILTINTNEGIPYLILQDNSFQAFIPEKTEKIESTINDLFIKWYQQNASLILEEKTNHFAKVIGVYPKSITIKNYKSRWGACSIEGNIFYNWRLILTPIAIIDYVVVHELCHMLEHNHSKRYWQHVMRYLPDHKERRKWLRENAIHISHYE